MLANSSGPRIMDAPRINPPELFTRSHKRIPSLSPTRSPTRQRITEDILADLSPTTTLEAFTNPSGKLRASVEAATPSERAFGIRATLASKKIQEWVDELSAWSWPAGEGPAGFEIPTAKRRRISVDERMPRAGHQDAGTSEEEYIGSLPAEEVARYENRIDDIHEDMDDLNVEEIKSTVLNTHFSPKSRPSSSGSNAPVPSIFSNYTRMDDFTAVVTATVLQALPNLSRLMRLMDVWTVRLLVLRKVPPLLLALDGAEVALKSGWQAIEIPGQKHNARNGQEDEVLERKTFEIMRDVLQDKVTTLGKDLDYMLDTLEGRQDTLPEAWLDRMETIETDYGEWVVRGDRKVREGEWARMARARKAEADRLRAEVEAREAARLKAENERKAMEEKLRLEQEDAARRDREQKEAEEKVRLEQEAAAAEAARLAELARKQKEDRIKAEEEAARQEAERLRLETEERERLEQEEVARLEREQKEAEEKVRLEQEAAAAEAARLAELARKQKEDRIKAEEEAARQEAKRLRLETEEREILEQEAVVEAARQAELVRKQEEMARQEADRQRLEAEEHARLEKEAAAELARKQEEDRIRAEEEAESQRIEEERLRLVKEAAAAEAARRMAEQEAARQEAERQQAEEAAAETAKQAEFARQREEEALKLKQQQAADAEAAQALKENEALLQLKKDEASKARELDRETGSGDVSEGRNARAVDRSAQESEPETISPFSTVALGIGAAVTSTFVGSDNEEVVEPEQHGLRREASHPSSPLISREESLPEANSALSIGARDTIADLQSTAGKPPIPISSTISVESPLCLSPISKFPPFDGNDEPKAEPSEPATLNNLKNDPDSDLTATSPFYESPIFQRPQTPIAGTLSTNPLSPHTPSASSRPHTPVALTSPSAQSTHGAFIEDNGSPGSPSKLARFGHGVANLLRRKSSPTVFSNIRPQSSGSQPATQFPASVISSPKTPTQASPSIPSTPAQSTLTTPPPPVPTRSPAREPIDCEWVVVEPAEEHPRQDTLPPTPSTDSSDIDDGSSTKAHNRNISHVSGYSTSDPTPEIHEAEPAEYFRPILSPIKSARSQASQQISSKSPLNSSNNAAAEENLPSRDEVELRELIMDSPAKSYVNQQSSKIQSHSGSSSDIGSDGAHASVPIPAEDFELQSITPPALAHKTSITRINSPIRRIEIPRRQSTASETSTVMNRQPGDAASSPLSPSSPISDLGIAESFPDVDEESPSKGRVRTRTEPPGDRSASGSPPPIPAMSPRRSFQLPKSPSFRRTDSELEEVPSTPSEAPVFDNIDLSEASVWSSPKKSTDDQLQAQISSLLESIPARIRLTSEPDTTPFPPADTLRPAKTRRSITPSLRSHSSLSMRAPTPSFTLAPAYGKGTSRPRPQNGNPEIKLYHLSRSTGEAPIKLFVRLVGENGERVMVRVGGGWADLGEYLREYASHHGRRSAVDSDKVEVQDIRPRVVSTNSTASSSATIRGNNGRSSPVSRPGSAFDRPMSSLHIRKTRRSVGETDSSTMTAKSPSTPMPLPNRGREYETPPSEKARPSSRLSWTEEEGGLGLAGPKAKKVAISERDQEWVESMKEKVRLASAEKEKKEKARDRDRKSFGEMERVGGTKRLFRKG